MQQSGKCYNCGQFGHRKDKCPNPKIINNTCFTCKQAGHKRENCPLNNSNPFVNIIKNDSNKCYLCNENGHKRENCPLNKELQTKVPSISVKIEMKLELGNMWGQSSALVIGELADLKSEFLNELLADNVVDMSLLDERNRTAHIDIKGNKDFFTMLNGKKIDVSNLTVKAEMNLIQIICCNMPTMHMTLIFKKNILQEIDKYYAVLNKVIKKKYDQKQLLVESKLIQERFDNMQKLDLLDKIDKHISDNAKNERKSKEEFITCTICMDKQINKMLNCGHPFCELCASRIKQSGRCPMCKTLVTSVMPFYL